MTEYAGSLMADFVSRLLSLGVPGTSLAEVISLAEAAFGTARSRGSSVETRERERIRKADYRSRKSQNVPRDKEPDPITVVVTKTQSELKKERKKELDVPLSHGTTGTADDGWPQDHLDIFWRDFPPYRRQAKAKVAAKLARIRSDRKVSWETIIGGVRKFAGTNPGEFAPAPMVWLNDGRWDREYGPQITGGSNGKTTTALGGFSGLGARLRQSVADERFEPGESAAGGESAHRR